MRLYVTNIETINDDFQCLIWLAAAEIICGSQGKIKESLIVE